MKIKDGAKQYMRNHNVPIDMQRRVQRWYNYSWSRYLKLIYNFVINY